jgi:hypothetical protein
MEKIDFHKTYKTLYSPTARAVQLVEMPAFNFVMIDGAIEPGLGPGSSPAFQEATQEEQLGWVTNITAQDCSRTIRIA